MRISRAVLTSSLSTAAGLLLSTSGSASSTINLAPSQLNTTSWQFPARDCDGYPDLLPTLDGWHFVLPQSVGARFSSITLTFSPGKFVVGPVTSLTSRAPTPGTGWSGYFADKGDGYRHAYVKVPSGMTLIGGTARVEPSSARGQFVLADVCARPSSAPRYNPPPTQSATVKTSPTAESSGASSKSAPPALPSALPHASPHASPSSRPASQPASQPAAAPSSPDAKGAPQQSAAPSGPDAKGAPQASTRPSAGSGPQPESLAEQRAYEEQQQIREHQPLVAEAFPTVPPAGGGETGGGGSQGTTLAGRVALLAAGGLGLFLLVIRRRAV